LSETGQTESQPQQYEVPPSITQPTTRPTIIESPTVQLLKALRETGKMDPMGTISYIMLLRELRRMEREDNPNPAPQPQIDVKELVKELNESWEKRFMEYQHRIETLLLGKKAEEAEKKAEELEKKLKEIEERKRTEEQIQKQVEAALTPLQERIKEIQSKILAQASSMSENERKSFFQMLGEEIEKTVSSEVAGTIGKTIRDSLIKAFTKEEEAPVTTEGKIDWVKMLDKWIGKTLDTIGKVVERMPPRPPQMKPIQQIPITPPQTTTITPREQTQFAELTPQTEQKEPEIRKSEAELVPLTKTVTETTETKIEETVKKEETQQLTGEARVEEAEAGGSSEAAGEGAEVKQEPGS